MGYDYESRRDLVEKFKEEWNRRLEGVSEETLYLVKQIELAEENRSDRMKLPEKVFRALQEENLFPSEMMKKYYGEVVSLYVPEEKREEYYGVINHMDWYTGYEYYSHPIFELLFTYKVLEFYGGNLAAYVRGELPEELLDFKGHTTFYYMRYIRRLIAAAIDAQDEEMIRTAREMLGEGEQEVEIDRDVLCGIMSSSDSSLHELVGRLLLAAGTQDGIRDMVCYAADAGTAEAFAHIVGCICENHLFRFGSVRLRMMEWLDIWDSKALDLLTKKYAVQMRETLADKEKAVAFCHSSDRVLIYLGLWGMWKRDKYETARILQKFQEEGTKDQLLVMAYFNIRHWAESTCRFLAERVLHTQNGPMDLELTAAYWSSYCLTLKTYQEYAKEWKEGQKVIRKVAFGYFFETEWEARKKAEFLRRLLERMPEKEVRYEPCIFPWHYAKITVSGILGQLCFLAHMLEDKELADFVLEHIGEIKKTTKMGSRADYVELLLHDPSEKKQVDRLVSLLADKESDTRKMAAELLSGCNLEAAHYDKLEGYLRLKNGEIRRYAIAFLKNQPAERITDSVERLLASGDGKMREGALDLIREVVKEETADAKLKGKLCRLASQVEHPKENEKILLRQILENQAAEETEPEGEEEGFGLYRQSAKMTIPQYKSDRQMVISYFCIERSTIDNLLERLAVYIQENADCTASMKNGETVRLDDYLKETVRITDGEYPFRELWSRFYEEEIKDVRTLTLLWLCLMSAQDREKMEQQELLEKWENELFGRTVAEYTVPENIASLQLPLQRAAEMLSGLYGTGDLEKAGIELFQWILEEMPPEEMWYKKKYLGWENFLHLSPIWRIRHAVEACVESERFLRRFFLYAQMDEKYKFHLSRNEKYYKMAYNSDLLDVADYVKAYSLGRIEEDVIYKKIFETWGLEYALYQLRHFAYGLEAARNAYELRGLLGETEEEAQRFMEAGHHIYIRLMERMLEEELKRGEMPTVFSEDIWGIPKIEGMNYFVEILKALGDEKLDRNGTRGSGKRECLSRLLAVCVPKKGDSGERLKEWIKDSDTNHAILADRRLMEAGMYAPRWLGILEEYFGIPGFRSGCCYFIAHMADWFSEEKKAMIARYTPLSSRELWEGAFDCQWFFQVYETLGEERFGWLYDAAKYISDGSKHVRARRYADAALGRITAEELEAKITAKRNKDLLMSYGLVPFRDKGDMLKRYEFLQRFLKESRNFGSMRRTSEAEAVQMALRNMASVAGYADTMRLTLAMESEAVKEYGKYMEWHEVEDVRVRIEISEQGVPSVLCEKAGKALKAVPARLKKAEWMEALLEAHKKMREQSRRCTRMFEQAMKEREEFCYEELLELSENPIAAPIMQGLVFICVKSGKSGYFTKKGLFTAKGKRVAVKPDTVLQVAHPIELFEEGTLEVYQRDCYAAIASGSVRKQPFKQIFREFYMKLEEELEQRQSHAFAGYQVEPGKALACLKGQGWIADVEEGIQKVCYGENIIAGIRVLSDWVTMEDLMTPSIDRIDFYDRENHKAMCIKDVPDVVYSEIMRDVDLAVSVAYVGGVDPETCRSTIEMRKMIAEYHLPLFGLTNVEFEGNRAVIQGKRAAYTVHMGSGVVHCKGGPQIYIKAVPAQRRGRIFLPFVDEDPKTAEILSKIILFAQDDKIRDREILGQMRNLNRKEKNGA